MAAGNCAVSFDHLRIPRHSYRNGNLEAIWIPTPRLPVIIMKIGVFILMRGLGKAMRNYYENRPFSSSCVA